MIESTTPRRHEARRVRMDVTAIVAEDKDPNVVFWIWNLGESPVTTCLEVWVETNLEGIE